MKYSFLFLLCSITISLSAQSVDATKTLTKTDSLSMTQTQRAYKVNMMSQSPQHDTVKIKAPNFLEPYKEKKLESNYNYSDGKVSGGSTQLNLSKKKKN